MRLLVVLAIVAAVVGYGRFSGGAVADKASTAPAGPGYSFMRTNRSGSPMRWNPCSAIHYRTNLAAAPPYAAADLQLAIAQVEAATGLRFVDDGATGSFPSAGRVLGASPAGPVIIAWATPAQSAALPHLTRAPGLTELGRAGPTAVVDAATGHGVYVSGSVVIDSGASRLPPGFGAGGLGVVLLHELGHLVGLGHSTDPGQVMYPTRQPTVAGSYGTEDLAGLRRLGAASGCLRAPSRYSLLPSI